MGHPAKPETAILVAPLNRPERERREILRSFAAANSLRTTILTGSSSVPGWEDARPLFSVSCAIFSSHGCTDLRGHGRDPSLTVFARDADPSRIGVFSSHGCTGLGGSRGQVVACRV
jgi:hypothetical protein